MQFRSWLVAVLVVAIVQIVLATLLVLQHNAVYSDLLRQRIAVIAQTTAATFKPILDLGLPISMFRDGDEIVARNLQIDPEIVAVHAVNPSGIVVHSTAVKPATLQREAVAAMQLADKERWSMETEGLLFNGFNILRDGREMSGAVVVTYPLDRLDAASAKMTRIAVRTGLVVWLATSVAALALIYGSLNRPRRKLVELQQIVDSETVVSDSRSSKTTDVLDLAVADLRNNLVRSNRSFVAAADAIARPDRASKPVPDVQHAPEEAMSGRLAQMMLSRVALIVAILIVASATCFGVLMLREVNRSIEPELAARTDLVGTVVSENVQRALATGVALDELVGAEQFFGDMLAHLPEVAYIAVATGRIVLEAGNRIDPYLAPPRERKGVRSHPIIHDGEEVAYVVMDIDPQLIASRFRGVFLDVAIIVLVSVLLAYEVMLLLAGRTLADALEGLQRLSAAQAIGDFSRQFAARGRGVVSIMVNQLSERARTLHRAFADARMGADAARLKHLDAIGRRCGLSDGGPVALTLSSFADIRLALFLFAAADELPLAFLPIYTRAAENLWPWVNESVLISLPLAGYLFAIVVAAPYARRLVERYGVRTLFLMAAVPTLLAHLGLHAATTAQEVILWRTVTGFGYALVTLAAQDYVIDVTPAHSRDRMLGVFTLVLFGGVFSGVALGGVLADRLGQANVFLFSATLIAVSALLSTRLIAVDIGRGLERPTQHRGSIWTAFRRPAFTCLAAGVSVPSSVILQAFVSYLVALTLDSLGASSAEIGRTLMLYFLTVLVVAPIVGRMIETLRWPVALVAFCGTAIAGASLLPFAIMPTSWTVLFAVIGGGAGGAMVRGTQVSMAISMAETEMPEIGTTAVLGALRAAERLGGIVGLLVVSGIAAMAGYQAATLAIALWALAGALMFVATGPFRNLTGRGNAG